MRISRRRSHDARGDGRAMTSVARIRERYRKAIAQAIPSSDPAWGDTWAHWLEDVGVLLEAIRQGEEELRLVSEQRDLLVREGLRRFDQAMEILTRLENTDAADAVAKLVACEAERDAARREAEAAKDEHGPAGQAIVERWLIAYKAGQARPGDCKTILDVLLGERDCLAKALREYLDDHDAKWETALIERGAMCPCHTCSTARAALALGAVRGARP